MQTLKDYILDAQRKEERFLAGNQKQWDNYASSRAKVQGNSVTGKVESILMPNLVFVTKEGRSIPCHNKATYDYYKRQEEEGKTI